MVFTPVRAVVASAIVYLAVFFAASYKLQRGFALTAFCDVSYTLIMLAATFAMLSNMRGRDGRSRIFWLLMGLGCFLSAADNFLWFWYEVIRGKEVPSLFIGDVVAFLVAVPMIAAIAVQPHARRDDRSLRLGRVDFVLLLLWWLFTYAFVVLPWQFVVPDVTLYNYGYRTLYYCQIFILTGASGLAWVNTPSSWRRFYAALFCTAAFRLVAVDYVNSKIPQNLYYTGSFYDVPFILSMFSFLLLGVYGGQFRQADADEAPSGTIAAWQTLLATLAILSIPIIGLWGVVVSSAPLAVMNYRILVTLIAMPVMTLLLYLKQQFLNRDLRQLLGRSQQSFHDLTQLQSQLIHSEKLASLGQLVAGAAHEINPPLSAIVSHSDDLVANPALDAAPRSYAEKIGQQARRTQRLVTNLLSFAQQAPAQKSEIRMNDLVENALLLREPDLKLKNIQLERDLEAGLPPLWGDPAQLLQVFMHILNNAVDAMEEGGGILEVRTAREEDTVLVAFYDSGPGIKEPQRIFEPFYTTKPVGKGTGLGLSVCYGIVQEHNGTISCMNRPEGGAAFHIHLPIAEVAASTAAGGAHG